MDTNVLMAVINTLGTIHVSGKEDLGRMLGCINALEELCKKE